MGSPLPQGPSIAPEMKYCADCGKQIPRVADFCPQCGCRQVVPPRNDSGGIFAVLGRGFGTILGSVVQYIGPKKAKFLFWLLIWFLAIRGTVLFLQEWDKDCDLEGAIHRFDGFGMWLIPCAVLLISYIRWACGGNRKRLGWWIVFPLLPLAILCTLGGTWWEAACIESKMVHRQPQRIDADVEQQPPRLPPEVERIPVAKWVQVQVYLPKFNYITKLSSCKPNFRCETQNEWVIGPNLAIDRTRITNETESHQPMYIEQKYETYGDDEKATVQAFCKAGFNIFQDVPMRKNMYGDFPDPNADRSKAVSVCVATPSPAPAPAPESEQLTYTPAAVPVIPGLVYIITWTEGGADRIDFGFCKPGFECNVSNDFHVQGPSYVVNNHPLKDFTDRPEVNLDKEYDSLNAEEKSTLLLFCQQGFNISGCHHIIAGGRQGICEGSVSVCDAVSTSSKPGTNAPTTAAGGATAPQTSQSSPATPLAKPNPSSQSVTSETTSAHATNTDLVLQVAATERTWVSVDADGQTLLQKLLNPNEVENLKAHDSFDVTVGNAQAVVLNLNGETLKPLGRRGEVKSIHLTRDDLKNAAPAR